MIELPLQSKPNKQTTISISAPIEEVQASAVVARNVSLFRVHLIKLSVSNQFGDMRGIDEDRVRVHLRFPEKGGQLFKEKLLLARVGVVAEFVLKSKKAKGKTKPLAVISLEYGASYLLPQAPIPKDVREVGIPAFARLNGPYTCWPYIRHEIHHACLNLGLGYILPLLRIEVEEPKAVKKKKAPSKAKKAAKKGKKKVTKKARG